MKPPSNYVKSGQLYLYQFIYLSVIELSFISGDFFQWIANHFYRVKGPRLAEASDQFGDCISRHDSYVCSRDMFPGRKGPNVLGS